MLAVHWIWSTYGTWLPGDARGHWSPLFDLYGHIIERGGKLNLPDPISTQVAMALAKESPRVLDDPEQQIVADVIGTRVMPPNCTGPGEPRPACWAAAVEQTHVHLLTAVPDENFGAFIGRLKGTTSAAVIAAVPGRKRTWSSGYWKVYLFDVIAVEAVMRYIEAHNERKGMAGRPYEWISPFRM
jgi:hypothetical protein